MYLTEIVCYRSDGSVDVVVQTEDVPARITRRHLEPTEMLKVKGTGENPAKTHTQYRTLPPEGAHPAF